MKKKITVLVALGAVVMPVPAASASESGAERALKRVIKRERGYSPQYLWCHNKGKRGRYRYYRCSGNTHRYDGSYPIRAKVRQKGSRYRVYSLNI